MSSEEMSTHTRALLPPLLSLIVSCPDGLSIIWLNQQEVVAVEGGGGKWRSYFIGLPTAPAAGIKSRAIPGVATFRTWILLYF